MGWKNFSLKKVNSQGQKVVRNKYKYGLPAAGAGWLLLDPNAGEKIGGVLGQGVENIGDAGVGAASGILGNQTSVSSSSSSIVVVLMVLVLGGSLLALRK